MRQHRLVIMQSVSLGNRTNTRDIFRGEVLEIPDIKKAPRGFSDFFQCWFQLSFAKDNEITLMLCVLCIKNCVA